MVKVFTVCSGIGGAELGLANSNFDNEEIEIIGYSEIDKYAAGIYQKHFPDHFNYGDITKINEEELPDFDLMIGGFPCFLGTEKVRTINGLVDIKDINVGDQVLTKNGYHSVKHVMVKHYHDKGNKLVFLLDNNIFSINCTKNHPFYIKHEDGEEEWVEAEFIKSQVDSVFLPNHNLWINVEENNVIIIDDLVYNLEVEEEHNYTVNDVLVHNCQAFSIAGYRKGFDDTRGTIFFDIARIMKEKKPKYALFENVKGLLSHDKGNTFQVILNTLDELGYDVSWNVLNSKHFGVPQNRERIYLRCHLREDGEDLLPDIRININNKQNGNLIKKDVVNKVRKRVYEVPEKELKKLLISAKRKSKLTTKQIANNLNQPLTKVEHYFRRDSSFSIPNENIWFDLKKILQIDTDEFDKAITTFEVVDGVYDSSNRVYDDEGISPTITTDAGSLIYTHKGKHQGSNIYSKDGISPTLTATDSKHPKYIQLNDASINKLNGSGPQGTRIYDSDGLAVTQTANGGGLGAKTGLYKIKQSNDNCVIENDANIELIKYGNQGSRIYDSEGVATYLNCGGSTEYYKIPEDDKQKTFKIKKVYGSNQKHRAETDGTYSPSGYGQGGNVYSDEGLSPTLCTNKCEGLKVSTATKKGYDEVYPGDGIRLDHPGSSTGRGRTQKESIGALTCSTNWGTVDDDFRVRRLIPLECERLQAFPDYWTEKGIINDKEVDISDTQRYKCCGNAFTTSVITYILNSFYDYDNQS